jgi:beta-lactamase regulating signal transducer with metallopeptidase domain
MGILQMSLSAGVLVIAIVLIRAIALNKLPKTMFLILWGVVLCRLLLPFSIPLPFGLQNTIGKISQEVMPDIFIPPVLESPINAGQPAAGITGAPEVAGQIGEVAQGQAGSIDPMLIIWLLGMLAVFIFFAAAYLRNQRKLSSATPINDNDFLPEWLGKHRLLRPVTIMKSEKITTPLTVGWLKPRIILPQSLDLDDNRLLNYVLTHEYYHIKRYDALWKMLLVFALCLHWYNPLVWLMFVLVNRDLELTCDEMVLRHFGAKAKTAYAYTLIGLAEQKSRFTPLYNGFSKNAAEERIVSIMKTKKTSLFGVVLAIVLVAALTIGAFMAYGSNETTSPSGLTVIDFNMPDQWTYKLSVDGGETWHHSSELTNTPLDLVPYKPLLFEETYVGENGFAITNSFNIMPGYIPGWSRINCYYKMLCINDKMFHVGAYGTEEKTRSAAQAYCDEEIKAGRMDPNFLDLPDIPDPEIPEYGKYKWTTDGETWQYAFATYKWSTDLGESWQYSSDGSQEPLDLEPNKPIFFEDTLDDLRPTMTSKISITSVIPTDSVIIVLPKLLIVKDKIFHFFTYSTEEKMLSAVKTYCDSEVMAGRMSQDRANEIGEEISDRYAEAMNMDPLIPKN